MPPAGPSHPTAIPRPPRFLAAALSAPLLACSLADLSSYSQGEAAAGASGKASASGQGGSGQAGAGQAGAGQAGAGQGGAGQAGAGKAGAGQGGGGQGGGQGGAGQAGAGQGGAVPCTTEKDCPTAPPCLKRACASGKCSYALEAAGTPCDDGLACTTNDKCDGNQCKGTPTLCESSCSSSTEVKRACAEPTGECKTEPDSVCTLACKDGKVRQPFCNASKTGCDEKPCEVTCSGNLISTGKCAGDGLLCEFSACPGNLRCKDTSQCHDSCPGAGADVCATGYVCIAAGKPCEPAPPAPGK